MWDMNGPDVPLHYLNELRVPLIRNALLNYPLEGQADCHTPKPLKGYSILDVGCGAGILTEVKCFCTHGRCQYMLEVHIIWKLVCCYSHKLGSVGRNALCNTLGNPWVFNLLNT